MALKSNVVILSEDQVLEAVARYLRDTPYKYDVDYVELVEIMENEDGTYRFEFEAYDAS